MSDGLITCRRLVGDAGRRRADAGQHRACPAGRRPRQRRADHRARYRAARQAHADVDAQGACPPGCHRRADQRKAQGQGSQEVGIGDHQFRGRAGLCVDGEPHADDCRSADPDARAGGRQPDHAQVAHPRRHCLAATRARALPIEPADRGKGLAQADGIEDRRRRLRLHLAADPVHRPAGFARGLHRRAQAGSGSAARPLPGLRRRNSLCPRTQGRGRARPGHPQLRRPAGRVAEGARRAWRSAI